jgi:hypothetical protein
MSIDPISEKFPHVSPYNYAENRVPNGIDLWGLQFVNANKAKIYIHGSGAALKYDNLSRPTQYRINNAGVTSGTNPDGSRYIASTFSTQVGSLNFASGQSLERRRPPGEATIVTEAAATRPGGGNASQRRKWRRDMTARGVQPNSRSTQGVPPGTGARGVGRAWALSEAANFFTNSVVNRDLMIAQEQFQMYGTLIEDILEESQAMSYIPSEFQNYKTLGDIGNYIFQGEFINNYDNETFEQLRDLSQFLMQNFNIPLNCESCQEKNRN